MREIKFRVYSTNTKQLMYLDPKNLKASFNSHDLIQEEDWKVMQYTGLKDKNGVEIYEGDIVVSDSFYKEPQKVQYSAGMTHPFLYYMDADEFEVIGNIHENPELL